MLPDKFKVLVVTLSDRASRGEYEDLSGPLVLAEAEKIFSVEGWKTTFDYRVIPDEETELRALLESACSGYNIIFTTGGTGIGPRDITVDVVKPFITKEIPGIMELIRVKYGLNKPNAVLSRGIAGVAGKALIFTLPGSVRAVKEYMNEIGALLGHAVLMQYGIDSHGKQSH